MSTSVTLPALGESVTEGTVTRWLKSVGDAVATDEPLLEVSTDKVDTEIPSPVSGTLLEIKAEEDETVEVGAELCVIGDEGHGGTHSGSSDSAGSDGSDGSETDSGADTDSADTDSDSGADTGSGADTDSADTDSDEAQPESAPSEDQADAGDDAASEGTEESSGSASTGGSGGEAGSGTPVKLPALGESVTEGTVTRWLKSVGDEVAVDEPLLEVSTDKVDTEIPSPVAGTLREIKVEEDETVEVGAELCVIGSSDAARPAERRSDAQPEEHDQQPAEEPVQKPAEEPVQPEERQPEAPSESGSRPERGADSSAYVTPLVRKMATEKGVDLASIKGTGVGGRIRKQDVLAAAEDKQSGQREGPAETAGTSGDTAAPAAPSPLRGKTEQMSRLRKVIAKRMVESLQVSAQLTTVVEVDVTKIARLRASVKDEFASREGVKLSFMPFFAKAAIDALKAHPSLNAAIDTEKGEITYFDHENLAIAVDTEKGLLTPVIKDAGDLSISGLAKKIADLADRTRANKIGPDELAGGTFTLTNTGSRGALFDTPIINQPQVAILGTGSVVKRPVVIDDANLGETIAVRQMVYLALTYDHRLVDGADAARFLSEVKDRLESGKFDV